MINTEMSKEKLDTIEEAGQMVNTLLEEFYGEYIPFMLLTVTPVGTQWSTNISDSEYKLKCAECMVAMLREELQAQENVN